MTPLAKRQLLAHIARPFALGYSSCYRCGMPWKFTEGHATPYRQGRGCFPLCEPCWSELAPEARLPFYERLVEDWHSDRPEDARAILEAARTGA